MIPYSVSHVFCAIFFSFSATTILKSLHLSPITYPPRMLWFNAISDLISILRAPKRIPAKKKNEKETLTLFKKIVYLFTFIVSPHYFFNVGCRLWNHVREFCINFLKSEMFIIDPSYGCCNDQMARSFATLICRYGFRSKLPINLPIIKFTVYNDALGRWLNATQKSHKRNWHNKGMTNSQRECWTEQMDKKWSNDAV